MNRNISILFSFFALCLASFSFTIADNEQQGLSSPEWTQYYSHEDSWSEANAVTYAQETDEILIAATERNTKDFRPTRFTLIRIDAAAGTAVQEISLKAHFQGKVPLRVYCLSYLQTGKLALVGDFDSAPASVLILDREGNVESNHQISISSPFFFSKIVVLDNGGFLLLGQESLNAVFIKFDSNGRPIWRKTIDRDGKEWLIDGVQLADEGFVLAGNFGDYETFFMGNPMVWIGRFKSDGSLISEMSFEGRFNGITLQKDHLVALYDKFFVEQKMQRIFLKGLSFHLDALWESAVAEEKNGLRPFRIVTSLAKGIAVAGSKEQRNWVAGFSDLGQLLWTYWDSPSELSSQRELLSKGDYYFLVSSPLVLANGDHGSMKMKIKVMKFGPGKSELIH